MKSSLKPIRYWKACIWCRWSTERFFSIVLRCCWKIYCGGCQQFLYFVTWLPKIRQWLLWEVWSINCSSINVWLPWSKKHPRIVGLCLLGPANWCWKQKDIQDFDIQTKLQELSGCADEDTFQNVLSEFPERYTMGVTAAFLHMSADKDNVIKNIIHHCCILSCLEKIRNVQKEMSTLGVSIVLSFLVSHFLFIIAF